MISRLKYSIIMTVVILLLSCTTENPVEVNNDVFVEDSMQEISYIAKAEMKDGNFSGEYVMCKLVSEVYCINDYDLNSIVIEFEDTTCYVQENHEYFNSDIKEYNALYMMHVDNGIYNLYAEDSYGISFIRTIDTKGSWKYKAVN